MIEESVPYSTLLENKRLKILFFILFFVVIISLIYIYRYYFWPFLFAIILYVALRPLYDFVTRYIKRRLLSSALVIFSLFILVLIPIFFILISLADQAYELYLYLQQQFRADSFEHIVQESETIKIIFSYLNISKGEISQQIIDVLSKTSLKIFSNITALLSFSIHLIINIFFMLLMLFFLFKDGNRLDGSIYRIFPFPEDIQRVIIDRVKAVINVLLAGNILIMISQGFVVGIAFYIFEIRMPLLWASITAVFSLIPGVGSPLVWIPVVIYFIYRGAYLSALIIGIWCLLGYLILENIVKPKVFGERLNFHPLIFFFLLLGSIQAFNLPGVIIGPILLTLFYSFWEIYKLFDEYSRIDPSRTTRELS